MAGRPICPLTLSYTERKELEQLVSAGSGRSVKHAQIILCRASGLSSTLTAQVLNCSTRRVARWSARFRKSGLKSLRPISTDKPKQPAKPKEIEEAPHQPPNTTTMRLIAKASGVSVMTVSRVVQNHPNVRPELRKLVLDVAQKKGYRPDPELSKLMIHLRKRKVNRFQGTIYSLEARNWDQRHDSYFRPLVTGAKKQAESLGFIWETFPIEEFFNNPKYVARKWHNCGVQGIFLPPASYNSFGYPLPPDEYWTGFSVVAATYSIPAPVVQRVVPNHFKNMTLICKSLIQRGYHRIGLVIPESLDKRVEHHFSGSFSAFHIATGTSMISPLLYGSINDDAELKSWFDKEKPDALIVSSGDNVRYFAKKLNLKLPGPVAVAAITIPENAAGIDELPDEVGSRAAELLGSMIIHRKTGLPARPDTLMVEGIWQDGFSASQR